MGRGGEIMAGRGWSQDLVMPLFNIKFQLVLGIVKIVNTIAAKLLFSLRTTFDMLNANSKLFNKLFIASSFLPKRSKKPLH